MIPLHTLVIAATFCVTGYAQTPVEHDTQLPDAVPTGNMPMSMGGPDAQMARMDEQMQSMMQMMMDRMPPASGKS